MDETSDPFSIDQCFSRGRVCFIPALFVLSFLALAIVRNQIGVWNKKARTCFQQREQQEILSNGDSICS